MHTVKRVKSKGIRVATKVQGERIRRLAQRLADDPLMVLPECRDEDCEKGLFRTCSFASLRKKLEVFKKADSDALAKYADKKGLTGAVAGTILLAKEERIPYLAAKNIGGKTYVYAKRGGAEDEKLIAVQNYDDPHIRMLAVLDIVTKKKIYLYSITKKMICMGANASPPPEFLSFILQRLGFLDGHCEHVVTGNNSKRIILDWKPADITLEICFDCAEHNTLIAMTQFFYSPFLKDEVRVSVQGSMVSCHENCGDCPIENALSVQVDDDPYFAGEMSDRDFIKNWEKKIRWNIEKLSTPAFVVNGICYGQNSDAVIAALDPQPWEETGLRLVLSWLDKPLVIDNATSNKILSRYWGKYGQAIVKKLAGDRGVDILRRQKNQTPSEILEMVYQEIEKQNVLSSLPVFDSLPALADFAHRIALAFRVGGVQEAVRIIHGEDMDVKKKAVSYAFLLAINRASGEQWRYTDMERDYGAHLLPYANTLLKENGEAYRQALQEMLTAAGSTKKLGD